MERLAEEKRSILKNIMKENMEAVKANLVKAGISTK